MQVESPAPRRRPLWRLFIAPALLLIAAAGWSAFWFYAASQVGVRADAWRAQEAKSGRYFDCGKRTVAGFPFRFEVACEDASVKLVSQTASNMLFAGQLAEILVVAQIYDPKIVIADFKAPASIAEIGSQAPMRVDWAKARASVVGLPAVPQRGSIVFDEVAIDRTNASSIQVPVARAKHAELHGRIAEGSPSDHPVIETVLQINSGSVQGVHPVMAEPFNADIRAKLTGLKDFAPKPWPERFRELAADGGKVEIVQSRIQQGEMVAVAAGTLTLNANGNIDGELQMTVTGLERIVPALGIDKILEEGVPQATLDRVAPGMKTQDLNSLFGALDKAIPGLGKVVKQNAGTGVAVTLNHIGSEATLEGKKARSFPLRFKDGAVMFGPVKVGQVPPLF
jgi:hypothetical protein